MDYKKKYLKYKIKYNNIKRLFGGASMDTSRCPTPSKAISSSVPGRKTLSSLEPRWLLPSNLIPLPDKTSGDANRYIWRSVSETPVKQAPVLTPTPPSVKKTPARTPTPPSVKKAPARTPTPTSVKKAPAPTQELPYTDEEWERFVKLARADALTQPDKGGFSIQKDNEEWQSKMNKAEKNPPSPARILNTTYKRVRRKKGPKGCK